MFKKKKGKTQTNQIYFYNCGLYRDDGLLIVKKRSPGIIEQLRKLITKSFQKNDLKVKIELCNQKVDFLDITMDLEKKMYTHHSEKKIPKIFI